VVRFEELPVACQTNCFQPLAYFLDGPVLHSFGCWCW
jgi:hypothetical protein